MSGFDLAQHVNQYLADNDYPVRSIAKINQNPERSKHLETATTSVLGLLVDFVNLRSETYNSDSRIPQIEFGTPTEDAYRRDITINALFYNIHTHQVEDFTGRGMDDLKNGVVRTPLAPFETFRDDPLRVLRVIRFASRFGYTIDESTADAIRRAEIKHDLDAKISRERVGVELDKMAGGPNPLLSIQLILEFDLYANVFRAPPKESWSGGGELLGQLVAESMTRHVLNLLDSHNMQGSGLIVSGVPESFFVATPESRRSLVLASYLYPYHQLWAQDRKKVLPVPHLVIRDGIKLSNHDVDATLALHSFAPRISEAAAQCLAGTLDRKTLGLQIRAIGARWTMAVIFAAAVELLGGAQVDKVTEKYKAYVDRVVSQGLVEAFNEKHIVDGKSAARLLGIKPGPAIRGVLDQVMEWQLSHPEGTRAECEVYIAESIAPTLAPQAHK
ncbi:poly A polymerase C-terminal region-like protein [Martensiomyces pterosporus]|nr:poly A polymerase C-terminal region-like protein [Martensiomyces pterosporus]